MTIRGARKIFFARGCNLWLQWRSQDFIKGTYRGSEGRKSPSRVQGQSPQKPEITVKNRTENSLKYNTNNTIETFPP